MSEFSGYNWRPFNLFITYLYLHQILMKMKTAPIFILLLFGFTSCVFKQQENDSFQFNDSTKVVEQAIFNVDKFIKNNCTDGDCLLSYSLDSSSVTVNDDTIKFLEGSDSIIANSNINASLKDLKQFVKNTQILDKNGIRGGYYTATIGTIVYPYKSIDEQFSFYDDYFIIIDSTISKPHKLEYFYYITDRESRLILVHHTGSQ